MATPAGPDPLTALAGELAQIGRRLDGMAAELATVRGPAFAPPQFTPAQFAPPQFTPPQFAPPQFAPTPFAPPAFVSRSAPPVERAPGTNAVGGARLLAWTGAAVTLLGVALLMALAASRGWFEPPVRIGLGTVLGIALVGLGIWLHRRENARVGAVAVAATGFATLYLVLAGATAGYGYLAPTAGLAVALLIAAGGLGLADRWRSRWLADGVAAGALVLAPLLTWSWLLVALSLTMSVAALPVVVRRRWPDLALVVGGLTAFFATLVCALDADGDAGIRAVVLAAATVVVGLATAAAAAGRISSRQLSALPPMAAVPALVTAGVLGGWPGAAVAAGTALATALLAAAPWIDRTLRTAAATSATVAVVVATAVALDGATFTIVLLGEALTAAVLAWSLRSRFAAVAAVALGCPGLVLAAFRDAPIADLIRRTALIDAGYPTGALVAAATVSALVLALAGALLVATGRLGWARPDATTGWVWAPLGVVGLYGVTGLIVNLAVAVSAHDGFTVGHAVVTVSWTVGALVLLARGLRRPALRVAGLVLVGAAVAKLVLFDLVALDGIVRVAVFIVAGLVLLAAGTRYARMLAETT